MCNKFNMFFSYFANTPREHRAQSLQWETPTGLDQLLDTGQNNLGGATVYSEKYEQVPKNRHNYIQYQNKIPK